MLRTSGANERWKIRKMRGEEKVAVTPSITHLIQLRLTHFMMLLAICGESVVAACVFMKAKIFSQDLRAAFKSLR